MGIKSSVKIQYWQNGVEAINYGENNKIISEANIEPDIGSPIFESIEAAYNAASLGFNLASGNFVSAGLNGLQLAASIHEPQIARRVRAYQKPFIDNEALLIQPSQDVLCRVRLPCLVKQFDFICVWTGEMVNTCSET